MELKCQDRLSFLDQQTYKYRIIPTPQDISITHAHIVLHTPTTCFATNIMQHTVTPPTMFPPHHFHTSPYHRLQQPSTCRYQYSRCASSRHARHKECDWAYLADKLIHDIRALMEDMRQRRMLWQQQREERKGGLGQGGEGDLMG